MGCPFGNNTSSFKLKIAKIEKKCKYHRREGLIYPAFAIAPTGICWELFYAIYPSCLAVLYNGVPVRGKVRQEGITEIIASCSVPVGVTVRIQSIELLPKPIRKLKELSEEFCKIIYRPLDLPFRKVMIEVINSGNICPRKYSIGTKFQFNTSRKEELCPAGFAAVYPYLKLFKDNTATGKSNLQIHCPDYVGVTYEIIPE